MVDGSLAGGSSCTRIDLRRALATGLSIGGYLAALAMYLLIKNGDPFATSTDLLAYLRAGSDLLAGREVYVGQIGDALAFAYAPTWAVAFAAISWLPPTFVQLAMVGLDLGAIRYVTGSWRVTGYVLWVPLVVFVISAGNVDLLIAAAIVMAWRKTGAPLALFGLAKIAPFLGLPIPWRKDVILTLIIAVLITVPWLGLWTDWFDYLLRQPTSISISLPLGPWWLRLPFALALLIPRRSYTSGLAVVVAMPSLYLSTLTILIAPLFLYLDQRRILPTSMVRVDEEQATSGATAG
jgi:hypothetical protein